MRGVAEASSDASAVMGKSKDDGAPSNDNADGKGSSSSYLKRSCGSLKANALKGNWFFENKNTFWVRVMQCSCFVIYYYCLGPTTTTRSFGNYNKSTWWYFACFWNTYEYEVVLEIFKHRALWKFSSMYLAPPLDFNKCSRLFPKYFFATFSVAANEISPFFIIMISSCGILLDIQLAYTALKYGLGFSIGTLVMLF